MSHFLTALLVLLPLVACSPGAGALTADAGEDFGVTLGEAPRFDACRSKGQIVNYRWTVVSAPGARAADAGKVIREVEPACSFTLEDTMDVDEVGRWVVALEVEDAAGNVVTDTVNVDVAP